MASCKISLEVSYDNVIIVMNNSNAFMPLMLFVW